MATTDPPGPRMPLLPDYGLPEDYVERAARGAIEWEMRERERAAKSAIEWEKREKPLTFRRSHLPTRIAFLVGLAVSVGIWQGAILLPGWMKNWTWVGQLTWLAFPLIVSAIEDSCHNRKKDEYRKVNQQRDHTLLMSELRATYHPSPEAWNEYADAVAVYNRETTRVYLPQTGQCYHNNSSCCNMIRYDSMPKYVAVSRGYHECAHCGRADGCRPELPSPFGRCSLDHLPENVKIAVELLRKGTGQ